MPPTRTIPPSKVIKTERTHEENQERAYIAASRRSDRSLEARVESARRASEIHKRRTGRSLRVTEQDVINEEMYEEEDDDMPFQYRRLTAHLQTNSADFNRRLQDYLTTHMAMRSALANSYAMNGQPFPGHQQFPNAMMFPSPIIAHQQNQPPPIMQSQLMQTPNPMIQRQSPYPSPSSQQHNYPHRSTTLGTPQELAAHSQRPTIKTERSASVPAVPQDVAAELKEAASALDKKRRPSFPQGSFSQLGHTPVQNNHMFTATSMDNITPFGVNHYPFNTTIPITDSQMFLGSPLNPHDPLTSMFMVGADPSQFYDLMSQAPQSMSIGKHQQYPAFHELSTPLAPSAQEAPIDCGSFFDQAIDSSRASEFVTSPSGTPGVTNESWTTFIDTDQWDVPSSSSQ